ncbi:MAG: hypothetical protein ACHQEM_12545, partial [Chitinophagales bacterium]
MTKKKDANNLPGKKELNKKPERKNSELEQLRREIRIESSLEQVRARTIAMQKSDELAEAVSLLFKQLVSLGIRSTQMRTCAITTFTTDAPVGECWITKPDGEIIQQSFTVPYNESSAYRTIYDAWKQGEQFLVLHLKGDALIEHLTFLKKYAKIPSEQYQAPAGIPSETYTHAMFFSKGYLFIISNEPLVEYHDVFNRMGTVFQQTYTRFLDLQRAESQARESQIQLALERVRARTMAMQRSEELAEAASLLFKQVSDFGVKVWSSAFQIWNADDISTTAWPSAPDGSIQAPFRLPYNEDSFFKQIYEARLRREDFFVMESSGKELEETYHYMLNLPGVKKYFDDALDSGFSIPK